MQQEIRSLVFNHHSMDRFIEVTHCFIRLDSWNVYNIFSIYFISLYVK